MKIVVGLGNPGTQYDFTRHNLGFRVLDILSQRWGGSFGALKTGKNGLDTKVLISGTPVLLVKPMTFMNRSGECVTRFVRNAEHEQGNLLVVVDELSLPLGKLRFRLDGSAGGHNGLKSIIERLGSKEFHRLRLGISDESGSKGADFVLSKFKPDEKPLVEDMLQIAADAVEYWVKEGAANVMNRFN